jgi:hypothetical protein
MIVSLGKLFFLIIFISSLPDFAFASEAIKPQLNLTSHWAGYISLVLFILAYAFVMAEEFTHMRKSKPVLLAAGLIWGIIAWVYADNIFSHAAEIAVRHNILEFAELFLFLLVVMTYIMQLLIIHKYLAIV